MDEVARGRGDDDAPGPTSAGDVSGVTDGTRGTVGRTGAVGQGQVSFAEATRAWFVISLQTFGGPAGPDRGDAADVGGREGAGSAEQEVPARSQLLHVVARAGGAAARDRTSGGCSTAHVADSSPACLFVLPGFVALLALSAVYAGFRVDTLGSQAAVRRPGARGPGRRGIRRCVRVAEAGHWGAGTLVGVAVVGVPRRWPCFAACRSRSWPRRGSRAGLRPIWWTRSRSGRSAHRPPGRGDRPAPCHAGRRACTRLLRGPRARRHPGARARDCGAAPVAAARCADSASESVFMEPGPLLLAAPRSSPSAAPTPSSPTSPSRRSTIYGWLAPGEMVSGLALAETTPGPLIMVVQFVAFMGAYRKPGCAGSAGWPRSSRRCS